jgi:hypothetical protein
MGCNCRKGVPSRIGSSREQKPKTATATVCSNIEQAGDNLNVTINMGGLFVSSPLGSSSLNALTFLKTQGCNGPTASTVRSLSVELAIIFSNPTAKKNFLDKIPYHNLKLHYLKELIKNNKL